MELEREREREREKILQSIILNSTSVLPEAMKKKNRKKRRAIWIKDWLKRGEEKGALVITIVFIRKTLSVFTRFSGNSKFQSMCKKLLISMTFFSVLLFSNISFSRF